MALADITALACVSVEEKRSGPRKGEAGGVGVRTCEMAAVVVAVGDGMYCL